MFPLYPFVKIRTAHLTGPSLDWVVAKCEGLNPNSDPKVRRQYVGYSGFAEANGFGHAIKHYSTDWSQGGPIIEREGIKVGIIDDSAPVIWAAQLSDPWRKLESVHSRTGTTPLVAAMRCYVESRMGEFVEVPDELCK